MTDACTCVPAGNPSVVGSCGCPVHGMKALRAAAFNLLSHPRSAKARNQMDRALGANPFSRGLDEDQADG